MARLPSSSRGVETTPPALVAGIELGGTKCIAVLARGSTILARYRIPTGAPEPTLDALTSQLRAWQAESQSFAALGIGSFGPLVLDEADPHYGHMAVTPKPGWAGIDLLGRFSTCFAVPIGFDTDVAGAALAEVRWGAARGDRVCVYVTVGTGIGGGIVVDGVPLHGLLHPEIGHLRLRRPTEARFPGICRFHGDCIEGLASGPAIAARAGLSNGVVPPDHPVWRAVADDLAELMAMLVLTLSPQRILVGGGVPQGQSALLPLIRAGMAERLGSYLPRIDAAALDRLIVPPALGDDAGPLGAVALAQAALEQSA